MRSRRPPWLLALTAMFPFDEEGEPAEHALLAQARLALHEVPDPVRELLVVRHVGSISLRPGQREASTRTGMTYRVGSEAVERRWMFCSSPIASMPANIELPPYDTNGRGTPVTGMMPRHMPTFWNAWKPNQQAMPRGGDPAEDVVGVPRRCASARQIDDAEQRDQHSGPDQAELLPRDREDEVGVLLGHEAGPRQHRAAAVRDERQRDAGDRHDAQAHADVLEGLEAEPAGDAGGGDPAEDVVGVARRSTSARQITIAEQRDQHAGADQAELLAGDGEDEVGVLLGHEAGAGLRAVEEALRRTARRCRPRSGPARCCSRRRAGRGRGW